MHSEFPCKHYYLGLKDHDRSSCKLSHGKPLTSSLRSILLKHILTASPDLLGDFPKYTTERLHRKLDRQHKKLELKYSRRQSRLKSPDSDTSSLSPDVEDGMNIFSEVLRDDQISLLLLNGIDNIDKFRKLTVGQLSYFGINVEEIQQILQKAIKNLDTSNDSKQSG